MLVQRLVGEWHGLSVRVAAALKASNTLHCTVERGRALAATLLPAIEEVVLPWILVDAALALALIARLLRISCA